MNRRQFILNSARYGLSAGLISVFPHRIFAKENNPKSGICILDAHSHPYTFYKNPSNLNEHTFEMMHKAGIVATSIAAVGDYALYSGSGIPPYHDTLRQLAIVQAWEDQGFIEIIRKPQQIRRKSDSYAPIGAILTIEGGDALEGEIDHLDEFYEMGVRIITLIHKEENEIGTAMTQFSSDDPEDGGLKDFGYNVVERMNKLGILIYVAHSSAQTLFDVAACTRAPIIDSHTNPLPPSVQDRGPSRIRTYTEIEAVVETGGVLGTWPLAYYSGSYPRQTFEDWAKEIKEFNAYFGRGHIALGTDSGGGLPDYVKGWNDITDLNLLEEAMCKEGLKKKEIEDFMGDNLLRVLKRCFVVSRP